MSDLAEFLRARYTERLEAQGRIFRDTYQADDPCPVCQKPTWGMSVYVGDPSRLAKFEPCEHEINDPAQLDQFQEPAPDPDTLADLDVKLAIVDLHAGPHECSSYDEISREINSCQWVPGGDCTTLRLLAKPFGEHPDYRAEEWAA